jgi:DNA-binding transcriptional regulator YdaS (Cro superfamily)
MNTPLQKTKEILGGTAGLARKLGIKYQAVQQWKKIPPRRALQIEEITSGAVTAREILEAQK